MSGSDFRFVHPVPVRFKDVDVGGHAHHSHALVYFEEARAAWWENVSGRAGIEGVNYILAEITARYHARVLWPQTLSVAVRATRLTRKTFQLEYEVRTEEGERAISGSSVQVMYDYEAESVSILSSEVRAAIERFEGLE